MHTREVITCLVEDSLLIHRYSGIIARFIVCCRFLAWFRNTNFGGAKLIRFYIEALSGQYAVDQQYNECMNGRDAKATDQNVVSICCVSLKSFQNHRGAEPGLGPL